MATERVGRLLLDIQHLSVDYGVGADAVHAVDDVSLSLRRGEVLGLAGESGSGKSTLAYAVSRLLRQPAKVTGGRVLYHSHASERAGGETMDILGLSEGELRLFRWDQLAIVFQSAMNSLNPVLTIGTQIDDVLRAHRSEMTSAERKTRSVELLRLVGISADRVNSFPLELSGGMRQRAGIAIAMALSPDIIIMDEPTTALDVVVQREILIELLRLRHDLDLSVIFITHDLSLLLELADTIAIMYAGRLVELATRRELYRQPRHPYSYGLINSFPTLRGPRRKVTGIPGSPPDLRHVPSGCAFHPRCPFAFKTCQEIVPALMRAAPEQAQQVACHLYDPQLVAEPPTLADMAARYEAASEGRAVS